jgi:peptidyl-prolyl cis-trans isomerase A (cyclophilin A)
MNNRFFHTIKHYGPIRFLLYLLLTVLIGGFIVVHGANKPTPTPTLDPSPTAQPTPTPLPKTVRATLKTSLGDIELELNAEKAPVTVKNFLQYIDSGFYKDTLFHRVIPKFMIQGGGFTKGMVEKKGQPPIINEAANGLHNTRGTIAMARSQNINSATSQFYINLVDNPYLDQKGNIAKDYGYCVFGKVTKGMDVVDKIAAVPTATVGVYQNVPKQDIVILDTKVIK